MSIKQFMKSKSIREYREAKEDSAKMADIENRTAGQVLNNAIINPTNDKRDSKPHCPKCKSENIQLLGQNRKGFSVGKAVGGGVLTGGIGTLAGFAGKKGKYEWVCMDCGNRFVMK